MQDNEMPPIEGELTDEDLKQVSGGTVTFINNGTSGTTIILLPPQAKPEAIIPGQGPVPHPGSG